MSATLLLGTWAGQFWFSEVEAGLGRGRAEVRSDSVSSCLCGFSLPYSTRDLKHQLLASGKPDAAEKVREPGFESRSYKLHDFGPGMDVTFLSETSFSKSVKWGYQ